jgi:sulfate adenylyltransferase
LERKNVALYDKGTDSMKKFLLTLLLLFSWIRGDSAEEKMYLNSRQLCDLEMLLNGGFAPLKGFMNEADYLSVVTDMRLENGRVWPMPIVLDVDTPKEKGDKLYLLDREHVTLAILTVEECFEPNKELEAELVYGTKSSLHPGVAYLFEQAKRYYVSGSLQKVALPNHYSFQDLRRTPEELKAYFKEIGADQVVAFQTRNPMHRAHVELTKRAIEKTGAHLLIQPIVGLTKPGDIDSYTRVACYRKVLEYYAPETASLSVLPLAMRMAGPREALWHALIRKNFGATHFIVGRDHAGPGNDEMGNPFYLPFAAQELVKKFSYEIGIEMIPFQEVVYVASKDAYLPTDEVEEGDDVLMISGTEIRRRLYENLDLPHWFSYPEVVQELRRSYPRNQEKGLSVFFTGLSGAGKSTLAQALCEKLQETQSRSISIIDGDEFRKNFTAELGFSKKDRSTNIRRAGCLAAEIAKNKGLAICAFIAPYEEDREFVREVVSSSGGDHVEVHLSTSLEVCERRDVKGLYRKARTGDIPEFTGVSDPYEVPTNPEITIDTSQMTTSEALDEIIEYLKMHQYI